MRHVINDIIVRTDRPETLTQAYHAGVLVSMIENYLPSEKIPSLGVCLANFHSLRELFGERLWQKLRARKLFTARVRMYEALTYQPFMPKSMIGNSRDFCLGYARSYDRSKLKALADKHRQKDTDIIISYLTVGSGPSAKG